jgi:signal peptidase II
MTISGGQSTAAPAAVAAPGQRSWRWLIFPVFAVTLAADLATKYWALQVLAPEPWTRIVLIPGCLDFRIAYNTGGAFSLLDGNVWIVTAVSVVCMAMVTWWARTIPRRHFWPHLALGLVAGGAIGNLHDRIRWHHVVDFIHAYVVIGEKEYAWPTFNVADTGIVVGIGTLLALGLFTQQLEEPVVVADPKVDTSGRTEDSVAIQPEQRS